MTSTTQAPGSEHNFQQKVIRSGQPHWISWVVLTICTALIPVTWAYIEMTPNPPAFLAVIGLFVCAITIGGAVYMTVYQGQSYARLFQLFTNLSPTILLMSVFPFISGTLNSQSIGNSRELMVVLAVSVTVPWIASTVSMPVYEPLATVDRRDTALFYRSVSQLWPPLLLCSITVVGLFALVKLSVKGWGVSETGFFMVGVFTNMLFSQAIIPAQETKRFGYIFFSWVFYAAFMFWMPQLWFLAPVFALLPHLVLLNSALIGLFQPRALNPSRITRELLRGALYGGVLWADKFLLVLIYAGEINIFVVYVALIPMVLAQGVYFASQLDILTRSMEGIRAMIDQAPCNELSTQSGGISSSVEQSVASTTLIASGLGLGMMLISAIMGMDHNTEVLALVLAPIVFLMLMLLIFELSQLQQHRTAEILSAIHIAVVTIGLIALPIPAAYFSLIIVDIVLTYLALRSCRGAFADAPYELFWKEAAKW